MIYDRDEIVRSYRQADNKMAQLVILAELTASDTDTIIQILKEEGALNLKDMKKRICCKCGCEYPAPNRKGLPVCPDCRDLNIKILDLERRIKRNNAKIAEHNRNIGKLMVNSSALREQIKELMKGAEHEK